jgi:uncharacterized protein (DUF2249 family)
MDHTCNCQCGGKRTVEEIVQDHPGARAVMAQSPSLAQVPAGRHVHLDVREDIANGREPFARIMVTVRSLRAGEILVLRAPFEPVPLYDVLSKRGFTHWTERLAADDWRIWFYAGAAPAPAPSAAPGLVDGRVVLDVRGLEPPQPMLRVLREAEALGPGGELEVRHDRRPTFLYPLLEDRGLAHETDEPEPGLVRIRIRRRTLT